MKVRTLDVRGCFQRTKVWVNKMQMMPAYMHHSKMHYSWLNDVSLHLWTSLIKCAIVIFILLCSNIKATNLQDVLNVYVLQPNPTFQPLLWLYHKWNEDFNFINKQRQDANRQKKRLSCADSWFTALPPNSPLLIRLDLICQKDSGSFN